MAATGYISDPYLPEDKLIEVALELHPHVIACGTAQANEYTLDKLLLPGDVPGPEIEEAFNVFDESQGPADQLL
jgi:hypothetical protein